MELGHFAVVLITKCQNSLHGEGGIFKLGVAKWEIASKRLRTTDLEYLSPIVVSEDIKLAQDYFLHCGD